MQTHRPEAPQTGRNCPSPRLPRSFSLITPVQLGCEPISCADYACAWTVISPWLSELVVEVGRLWAKGGGFLIHKRIVRSEIGLVSWPRSFTYPGEHRVGWLLSTAPEACQLCQRTSNPTPSIRVLPNLGIGAFELSDDVASATLSDLLSMAAAFLGPKVNSLAL